MNSGDPLKRKTPIKRDGVGARKFAMARSRINSKSKMKRSELRRGSKIAQRSEKRQKQMTEDRIPLVKSLIEAGFRCEIGPVLAECGIPNPDCTGEIQGLHERRKSSSGGSRENRNNLVPACNHCNGWLEDNAGVVREMTLDILVVREGDPEWEQLGARHDRMQDAWDEIPIIVIADE